MANGGCGRNCFASSWPNMGMDAFMKASDSPDEILESLTSFAGGVYEKSSVF